MATRPLVAETLGNELGDSRSSCCHLPELQDTILTMSSQPSSTSASPWKRAGGRKLSELVQVIQGPGPQVPCRWQLGTLSERPYRDVEAAAWLVAEELMRTRIARATHLFRLWRRAATGNCSLSAEDQLKITPFVQTAFGLPGDPVSEDHVQGLVAEYVWYLLAKDLPSNGRAIRRLEQPSYHVTSPGGDGLVTYEVADGTLIFRLWEIKKHTASNSISGTITRACDQLSTNGAAYLAQYVALAPTDDRAVAELYANLVDLWIDAEPQAGVGVAVATSRSKAPQRRCFTNMHRHFPSLTRGDQLEGLVAGIADFPAFVRLVRRFVWNAL